ncbi:MAG: CPBP family intramembrane metalloprotease, partial [Bacteroidales bacterium]|jgi:membrane protease YdiL (CAAX protease family)|nr:CPBP family intramembrane metalloprotease [Bacteroidales bacterium]
MAIVGTFGPMIGACVSLHTIEGKGSVKKYLKTFLSFNFGCKVWITIFLSMGIIGFIAWIIPEFFGEERLHSYLPSVFVFPVYLIFVTFLGGGQEEIGWAGYMMPRLEGRYGLTIGTLIRGIVWSVWHLPLWLVPGSSQSYMNFFAFTLMCTGYSFIFSWIIDRSGNRPMSAVVIHGVANGFAALFPFVVLSDGVMQTRIWVYSILTLIAGIIIAILRTYKSRKTST